MLVVSAGYRSLGCSAFSRLRSGRAESFSGPVSGGRQRAEGGITPPPHPINRVWGDGDPGGDNDLPIHLQILPCLAETHLLHINRCVSTMAQIPGSGCKTPRLPIIRHSTLPKHSSKKNPKMFLKT